MVFKEIVIISMSQALVFLSDDLTHDSHAVNHFETLALGHLKETRGLSLHHESNIRMVKIVVVSTNHDLNKCRHQFHKVDACDFLLEKLLWFTPWDSGGVPAMKYLVWSSQLYVVS